MSKAKKSVKELLQEALVPREEQPYEVPGNWVWVRTWSVAEVITGSTPSKQREEYYGGEIPLVKPADLKYREITEGSETLSLLGREVVRVVPPYSIMICCIGSIGKSGFNSMECSTNQQINSLIVDKFLVYFKYLFYQINDLNYFNRLNTIAAATTVSIVNKTKMSKLSITLAPLNEQKRIAAKIDRLFAKLDEITFLLQKVKNSHDLRRISVLEHSYRGQLSTNIPNESKLNMDTGENILYTSNKYPNNWVGVKLGDVVNFIGGGTPSKSKPEYWNGDIPWATVKDLKGRSLYKTQDYITKVGKSNSSTSIAMRGEVLLITRMAPGKSIISNIETAINQDLKIARIKNPQIHNGFLWLYFEAHRRFIEQEATGSTVKGIQVKKLKNFLIYLPPYEEQLRIVAKTNYILNNMEKEYEQIRELELIVETLKKSILNKAFRGELGTNDPTEDSALELLKKTLQRKST
ncbi:restriction endonuclease subunit S [Gracilibacillus phocaeensis]|uniref:restriction endonuclease subunit S n=1 Tax=Gracilibacillus phocaeensis TaxID=2042304 RepID=UPI00103037DD|nr:restriction endonuclease subunit S [Gracilibacillus phocaeensis]